MIRFKCMHCRRPRPPGQYLCDACWLRLPVEVRRRLELVDRHANMRRRQLATQLRRFVPLEQILVDP